MIEPTSLNRGEGLVAGLTRDAGGGEDEDEGEDDGGEAMVEEGENARISTVMRLMSVSNSDLPHR